MPVNISNLQEEIREARQKSRRAMEDVLRLDQKIARKEKKVTQHLSRNEREEGLVIKQEIKELLMEKAATFAAHKTQILIVKQKLLELNESTDPRELTSQLSDDYPVFLMPVRLEARFMTIKHIAKLRVGTAPGTKMVRNLFNGREELPVIEDRNELWIRIFPDDIFIQSHEEELTELEATAGHFFWNERKKARQKKEGESTDEFEARIEATLERNDLGAWTGLVSGHGKERAAWIAIRTTPSEADDLAGAEELTFPDLIHKTKSWSKAPQTDILPDRFVVKLVSGDSKREVVGNPIAHPLHLSISPREEDASIEAGEKTEDKDEDGLLKFPPQLRWLTDFHEAEKVGMAVRIPLRTQEANAGPLSTQEAIDGFDRIVVLGLCSALSPQGGGEELAKLFDNHIFMDGGLSILPQGTPTNNSDVDGSGYSSRESGDDDYHKIALRQPLFDVENEGKPKTDGEWLIEKLALSKEQAVRIKQGAGTDLTDAIAMNQVLWPATFGYYIDQMLFPLVSKETTLEVRDFFEQNVLGRGYLPTLRIDDQPYGMLVCSAFDQWEVEETETAATTKKSMLDNLLQNMSKTWSNLAEQVAHVKMSEDTDELLLSVTSKQASSVEFYQRNAVGRLFLWNLQNLVSTINDTEPPAGFEEVQDVSTIDFFKEFSWLNDQTTIPPNILDLVFTQEPQLLNGPMIDVVSSAESKTLSEIAPDWNYLRWLKESTWQQIFDEDFSNTYAEQVKPPTALLYLLTRHAVLLEYQQAGLNYLKVNGQPLPAGGSTPEISNLEGLDRSSRLAKLEKQVKQEELQKQNEQISQELAEYFAGFTGSETELREEKKIFRKERAEELSAGFNEKVESRINEADLETELLSIEEIWDKDYGELTNNQPLSQYVDQLLADEDPSVARLSQLKTALATLENRSTAQLERCFAEHIDLGAYRLDAWFYGLANDRLSALRQKKKDKPGNYLGAYGWLLDLRPGLMPGVHFEEVSFGRDSINFSDTSELKINRSTDSKLPKPSDLSKTGEQSLIYQQLRGKVNVQVAEPVADTIGKPLPSSIYLGKAVNNAQQINAQYDGINNRFVAPPRTDPTNKGFIHAPSINQATAAAILRAVYEAHRETGADNAYAVNINSKRVRKAISLLEGIQKGQTLGALLGYQFERNLNDNTRSDHNLNELVYDFRLAFPQVAGSITEANEALKIGEAEAYNVVDGLALLEAFQEDSSSLFNKVGSPPTNVKASVEKAIDELANAVDAIYDLMMAESIFQSTQGNAVRAGAALKMLNGKGAYTDPQVIKTPRAYHVLTHRVGVQFDHQVSGESVWNDANGLAPASPRSIAAPKLNHWLSTVFPSPDKIIITIRPVDGDSVSFNVARLGLQPIDFYYLLESTEQGAISNSFLKRIQWFAKSELDSSVTQFGVEFDNEDDLNAGEFNLFSLLPIIQQVKRILGKARALTPEDLVLPSETDALSNSEAPGTLQVEELKTVMRSFFSEEIADADLSLLSFKEKLKETYTEASSIGAENIEGADLSLIASLQDLIVQSNQFFVTPAYPAQATDAGSIQALLVKGQQVFMQVEKAFQVAEGYKNIMDDKENPVSREEALALCVQIAQSLFGKSFKVFPTFTQHHSAQFQAAFDYEDWLKDVTADAGEDALDDWWRDVAKTNGPIKAWHLLDIFTDAVYNERICGTRIVQLPLTFDEEGKVQARWLGSEYNADYEVPSESLSLVFKYPTGFQAAETQSGFVFDEWNEEIPLESSTTGLAVNYNAPNTEPPQVCLLAVSPSLTGSWSWDDLMNTLESTIDWAKKRGVDPDLLDQTPYAQALPITLAALSGGEGKVSLDFKRNIIQNPVPGNNGPVNFAQHTIGHSLLYVANEGAAAVADDLLDFEIEGYR